MIALVFAYIFLLLGEPDEEAKYVDLPDEELITMPMSALEFPARPTLQNLADTFGQPGYGVYGGPPCSAPACMTPPSAAAMPAG